MPKHGFMTAKAIGNRIKAKGLQKLRWYCEMCNKQCRDENGFKCHTMSEAHQRQLLIVSENPEKFVDNFSQQFLEAFLSQLKRTKSTKRISANIFYNEYIADKEHVHMNSTRWLTLTEFVKYLGKEGHCLVDETPKGWFIQYIDRDPEVVKRQQMLEKMDRAKKDEADRQAQIVKEMIERDKAKAAARGEEPMQVDATEFKRTDEDEKITLSLSSGIPKMPAKSEPVTTAFKNTLKQQAAAASRQSSSSKRKDEGTQKRKLSALEQIRLEEEAKKQKKLETISKKEDSWLFKGIVVKVMNKKLANGKYYKAKGVVKEVVKRYGAKLAMLDSKAVMTIDQDELQTVLPKLGGAVLIVNGRHRGTEATLDSIQEDKFSCTVVLSEGANRGKKVSGIEYEDVCKLY